MDSASALQALQSFQQPAAADVLTQAETKYGIPDLTKRVNDYKTLTHNLTGAIAAVDPSVTGRTAGTLTTEGQRGALVNRERAPIVGQLGTATTALEGATGDFSMAQGRATNEANATVEGNRQRYAQLLDQYNIANSREQAAKEEAARQAAAAEQSRQFEASLAASKAAASASGAGSYDFSSLLGDSGQPSTAKLSGGKTTVDADKAIHDLLNTKNKNTILSTYQAIVSSANRGNTYDQYKLKQINTIPEFQKYLINVGSF
jgi:hypothetical protein